MESSKVANTIPPGGLYLIGGLLGNAADSL